MPGKLKERREKSGSFFWLSRTSRAQEIEIAGKDRKELEEIKISADEAVTS